MKIKTLKLFIILFLPVLAHAGKTTYIYTDMRLNYVKLEEVAKKELKEKGPFDHPFKLTMPQIAEVLRNIQLDRQYLLGNKVETRDVFNTEAISFLAPLIVEAFNQAKPKEKIIFSYLVQDSKMVLRNDRLNIVNLWIADGNLHLDFRKLMAKMYGEYHKRGQIKKAVARAKSLRMSLTTSANYQYGNSTDEIIVPLEAALKSAEEKQVVAEKIESKKEVIADAVVIEKRLETLEKLKRKKLITKEEYTEKRERILKDL